MVSQWFATPSSVKAVQVRILYSPPYAPVAKRSKALDCNPNIHQFESDQVFHILEHGYKILDTFVFMFQGVTYW